METADDTRAKLLRAASEVFAERGYQAATIREICGRANVNVALVNYHYGDKLELYTEVLRTAAHQREEREKLLQLFESAGAPEEILRIVIRAMVERIWEKRDRIDLHMRLMVHEMVKPTEVASQVIDEAVRPLYNKLRGLVGQILDLHLDHDTTRLCTHSIVGQVLHYAHARPMVARLWPAMKMTAEQRGQLAKHIADFSLAYLRAYRKDQK
jgi:AcrR family transcriptional regulator